MANTGPSAEFLKKKKITGVKSGSSTTAPYDYGVKRGFKTDDEPEEDDKKKKGLFGRMKETKEKYNPFDRFVAATKQK